MGMSPEIRISIGELVLDGFAAESPELPASIASRVSAALVERGLSPAIAASTSTAVGAQVARSVSR
jgi:hypothetical protein